MRRAGVLAAGSVLAALLAYPLLALTDGPPRFPSRDECVLVATGDAPDLEVVYGRFDDAVAAESLLADVTRAGFVGADAEPDACGRWKVSYDAIDTFAQGQALAEQVRGAGFEARVEHEG
jgi:hypothetical protein